MSREIIIWSSIALAIITGIVGFGIGFFAVFMTPFPPKRPYSLTDILRMSKPGCLGAFYLSAACLSVYWVILLFNRLVLIELGRFNVRAMHMFIAAGVLVLGILAFFFKMKSRKWYGVVEVALAWFSAVSLSTRIVPAHIDLPSVMGLAGTVYFVSRGLDNYWYGRRHK